MAAGLAVQRVGMCKRPTLAALSLIAGLTACAEDVDVEPVDPYVCDYTGVWCVTLRGDDFKEVDHDWRLEVSDEPGRERVSLTVEGLDCAPGEHHLDRSNCTVEAESVCGRAGEAADGGTDLWRVQLSFGRVLGEQVGGGTWDYMDQEEPVSTSGDARATR
jgi:hypothetical protein